MPGYKQTDVGVIPDAWDCVRIASVARLESGHTPSRMKPSYWDGSVQWVSLHDTGQLAGRDISATVKTITEEGLNNSSARLLPPGTVVFSRTATVGKSTVMAKSMATSQDFANYICGPDLHNHYLVYLFRSMGRTWQRLMAGSIHNTIYMPVFKALQIPLPPLSEQRAIAAALSDVDALLGGLERLIAKKRDLKQAAMQQLLTGQTRLPGFHGEWEVKCLGDHVRFLRNGVNSRAELTGESSLKYLHYGDIHVSSQTRLDLRITAMPGLLSARAQRLDRLADGDVVFVDASEDLIGVGKSVELTGISNKEVVAGLHTIAARFDNTVLADGFKAFLQFCPAFRGHLLRLAAGTKVYATTRSHIASVEMPLPSATEQTAIATVLSDMDAELSALEARRDKTRALKQAMMQELLTGRVRLVNPAPTKGAAC